MDRTRGTIWESTSAGGYVLGCDHTSYPSTVSNPLVRNENWISLLGIVLSVLAVGSPDEYRCVRFEPIGSVVCDSGGVSEMNPPEHLVGVGCLTLGQLWLPCVGIG
jgi:hypothetical protein